MSYIGGMSTIPIFSCLDWDIIETPDDDSDGIRMERAWLPQGWLWRATLISRSWNHALQSHDTTEISVSIAFVPEPM